MKLKTIIYVTVGVYALFTLAFIKYAFGEETFAPGSNPVVEGKDICRVAAGAAQNFLAITDEAWEFSNTPSGCSMGAESDACVRSMEKRAALYEKVLKYQGILEITSSVCLGVEIDPSRLDPSQREMLETEKVES